jgi:hypothetical protein
MTPSHQASISESRRKLLHLDVRSELSCPAAGRRSTPCRGWLLAGGWHRSLRMADMFANMKALCCQSCHETHTALFFFFLFLSMRRS